MMKNMFKVCLLVLLVNMYSCKNKPTLTNAEHLIASNPDSTLILLESIKHPEYLSRKQHAVYQLLQTKAKDRTCKDISKNNLLESIDYFKREKNHEKTAYAYFYQNRIFEAQNQIEQAIKYCSLSKEYAEEIQDFNLLGLIYHDLGYLYKEQYNFKEALDKSKESLKYFLKVKNNRHIVCMHKKIGDIYLIAKQKDDIDSALIYYQKALEYAAIREDNQKELCDIYLSISLNLCEANLYEDAKKFGEQAITFTNNLSGKFNNYISLSDVHLKSNDPDSAFIVLNKALSLNENLNLGETYVYKKMLYRINRIKENHELALINLEDCIEYRDSIYKNTMEQNILEIQKKYENENLENERNKLLIERLYFIIFCLFLIFSVPVVVIYFKYKSKKQKLELLKAQQNIKLLAEMIQNQNNNEDQLRQFFVEKLDIVKKIAQMNSRLNQSDNSFIKQYYHIFGYSIAENLDWDSNLYAIFNGLYKNFVDRIKASYPMLTEKELQLCCLIKANFSKDEISLLMSYESDSIKTIRNRISKKLGFGNNDDFTNYIIKL